MRELLFLAHRLPFPPDRGDKIRSFHLLRYLSARFRVHLAAFADDDVEAAQIDHLREALGGTLGEAHVAVRRRDKLTGGLHALRTGKPISLTMFEDGGLQGLVSRMLERPALDTVFAYSGQMAQFVPAGLRQTFLMDFVDMDSAKFEAYAKGARGPMGWVYAREADRLFRFERETAARADAALFVSGAESALFRKATGLGNVTAVCNGIDTAHYDPAGVTAEECPDRLIVFTGQMDYPPNEDAVCWFAHEVLPRIPGAHFAIVGRAPTQRTRALQGARVTVTGAVPDVRGWLKAAQLVVAPLRIARGIQNKVLEAMAMARPVLATSAAFEGIEATPGEHLIVADGVEDMAASAAAMLSDQRRADRMGAAARQLMIDRYGWEARLSALDPLLNLDRQAAA